MQWISFAKPTRPGDFKNLCFNCCFTVSSTEQHIQQVFHKHSASTRWLQSRARWLWSMARWLCRWLQSRAMWLCCDLLSSRCAFLQLFLVHASICPISVYCFIYLDLTLCLTSREWSNDTYLSEECPTDCLYKA